MALKTIIGVSYEIQGDNILLEQDAGFGEVSSVDLHRVIFDHISDQLGRPNLSISAEMVIRKLEAIHQRLESLTCAEHYREEIINHGY